MRRRREDQAWTLPDVMPHACAGTPLEDEDTHEFDAIQTEKGALNMLYFVPMVAGPLFCSMAVVHVFGLQVGEGWILPPFLVGSSSALLWCGNNYIQRLVKRWPVVCGSVTQVAIDMIYVSVMVTFACQFRSELMRHRVFLTSFFPWVFGLSSISYVPWPIFLLLTCPTHLAAWFVFHRLEGFQPISCHIWGLVIIANASYLYRSRNLSWWQAFKASKALLKERALLQSTQDSLRGILSSIFDASCTCDSNGRLLECSPHLQAILDCAHIAQVYGHDGSLVGLNLCSFSASDLESHRLKEFLKSAKATAHHQAVKIQCSFMCKPEGSFEASLYAIALPAKASHEDEHGGLFISMRFNSPDLSTCRQEVAVGATAVEQEPALSTQNVIAVREELTEMHWSECLRSGDALPIEMQMSFASGHDAIEHHAMASLDLSDSIPSSAHHQSTLRFRRTASVETQTNSAYSCVDAEVQTTGSAAKPPVGTRDAYLRQDCNRVGEKRRPLSDRFRVTPPETIETFISVHLLQSINPKCSLGCCMAHRLLAFMIGKMKLMMKMDCRNWPIHDAVQCVHCGALQETDADDEFECNVCFGVRARVALALNSSSSEAGDISSCNAGHVDASD